MKITILKVISYLGLALTILPSMFVFNGSITIETHYKLMIVGMVFWFSTAPFWMQGPQLEDDE